jgi:hypothetical protein
MEWPKPRINELVREGLHFYHQWSPLVTLIHAPVREERLATRDPLHPEPANWTEHASSLMETLGTVWRYAV